MYVVSGANGQLGSDVCRELKKRNLPHIGIDVDNVRVFIRYDVENISDEIYAKACKTVFSKFHHTFSLIYYSVVSAEILK